MLSSNLICVLEIIQVNKNQRKLNKSAADLSSAEQKQILSSSFSFMFTNHKDLNSLNGWRCSLRKLLRGCNCVVVELGGTARHRCNNRMKISGLRVFVGLLTECLDCVECSDEVLKYLIISR